MGGRAFLQEFPQGSLPRLPTPLYSLLKPGLKAQLRTLFATVIVPPPAPEKKYHGDIDFVVACPRNHVGEVTPAQVGAVLGAVKNIELEGNRMSHYAIEISQEDWSASTTQPLPSEKIYCQVDVQVCDDEEGADGFAVFHGYGDLGIIICAIGKSHGLPLNQHGLLKIASPMASDPPLRLSGSPQAIFKFMRLSMDTWRKGFDTVEETFEFAATSRFFHPPGLYASSTRAFDKSVQGRSMYQDFLVWAQDKPSAGYTPGLYRDAVEEALVYFDQKEGWDAAKHEHDVREWLKSNFNGTLVKKWTGLGWKGVKAVMDGVRSSVGGERALVGMDTEEVKALVLVSQNHWNSTFNS